MKLDARQSHSGMTAGLLGMTARLLGMTARLLGMTAGLLGMTARQGLRSSLARCVIPAEAGIQPLPGVIRQ